MPGLHLRFLFWVLLAAARSPPGLVLLGGSWRPPEAEEFCQKADRFWAFQEGSGRWVEVSLPYDLVSCSMGTCTRVATIHGKEEERSPPPAARGAEEEDEGAAGKEGPDQELPVRRGFSLARMSEGSIWVTGQSGSIYERFWNGVQWVAAPHELPLDAGRAVSVFIVYQSVLALSELGKLYKVLPASSISDFTAQELQANLTNGISAMSNTKI